MAPFNPPVPDQTDPRYYLHLSRPIQQPHFQSGIGTALKDVGNMIEGAAKGANAIVDVMASDDARKTAEGKRNEVTSQLEDMQGGYDTAKVTQNSSPPMDPVLFSSTPVDQQKDTLFPQSGTAELPQDIKNIPTTAGSLLSARNSGKFSETHYLGQMASLAKDVRSRYPSAYRDVIDREFSKVTGGDPANLYIKSLLGDINATATSRQKDIEETIKMVHDHWTPGAEHAIDGLRNGTLQPSEVRAKWGPVMAREYQLKSQDLQMTNLAKSGNLNETQATQYGNNITAKIVSDITHGSELVNTVAGYTPEKARDLANSVLLSGKLPTNIDPLTSIGFGNMFSGWASTFEGKAREELYKTREGGWSVAGIVGTDKVEQMIANGRKQFESGRDLFVGKEHGLGYWYKNAMPMLAGQSAFKLFTDPDMHKFAVLAPGVKELVGEQGMAAIIGQGIFANASSSFDAFKVRTDFDKMRFIMPPMPGDTNSPQSFKELVQQNIKVAKENGIATETPNPVLEHTLESTFRLIDSDKGGMLDPNLPQHVKNEMARKTVGPENEGLLKLIQRDIVGPDGKYYPGRESWLWRLSRPEVAAEYAKTPYFKQYTDTVKTEVEKSVFPDQLRALADLQSDDMTKYKIKYENSDNGKVVPSFKLLVNGQEYKPAGSITTRALRPAEAEGTFGARRAYDVLEGVNKAFNALYQISKASGDPDIDAHAVDLLLKALPPGTDITKMGGMEGLPSKIVQSITSIQAARKMREQQELDAKGKSVPKWQ